jgi:urease accessory protein UreF
MANLQHHKNRDSLRILLELPAKDQDDLDELKKYGVDSSCFDNDMLVAVALFKAAQKGNIPAIKYIDERMGRNPHGTVSRLEEMISGISNI